MIRNEEDIATISQSLTSMSEAVEKLGEAKKKSKLEDFKKIKELILKLQIRISEELR
jgi:hypothetical protein